MQEHLNTQNSIAKPTPPTGEVDILVAREGLAMVMDGLRVLEMARVKMSKASIVSDGRICLLPAIEIPGHTVGVEVMAVMDGGKTAEKQTFTIDGVSVMAVMVAPVTETV